MDEEAEFKIKGAAARASESVEKQPAVEFTASSTPPPTSTAEDGEVTPENDKDANKQQDKDAKEKTLSTEEDLKRYRWCKCLCDPAAYSGHDHYFLHLDTQESRWAEPTEPYWLWNTEKQAIDESGLQQPPSQSLPATNEPDQNYQGYNPKIHGSYDPTAPYAQYHNKKRQEENLVEQGYPPGTTRESLEAAQQQQYAATGAFNRFTGAFQDAEKSADRHDDFNKSGRQMNAYFDVDAAANMHDGRSLKEERRNEKLSKKQIRELAEKRRAKKEKKRMDFYRS